MNTQRFGWPVIIAASLHGALFLVSKEPEIIRPPEKKLVSIDLTPVPAEPIAMAPEDPAEDPGGPVSTCQLAPPSIPDVLREADSGDVFTVPVTPYRATLEHVPTLENFTGLPTGPGSGIDMIGRPRLPGVDKLDRRPRAMVQPAPAYPDDMRRASIDGSVTVEFVVDTEGRVLRAEAVKWTHREFVDPAVRAVLRWRFEPGTQNGRKVSFRMAVPIEFNATE